MKILFIIQLAFIAYIVLQAYYNYYSIKIMTKATEIDLKAQSLWHTFQAISYVVICALISYLFSDNLTPALKLYFILMLWRQLLFNPILNVLRGKDFFYLSDRGHDLTLKKIFGKFAAVIITIISVGAITFLNFI